MTAKPTDLVVVLPGILGSTLYRGGTAVWSTSPGAVIRGILSFGRSVRDLRLPEGIGDEPPDDGVTPGGPLPDLHVLPGIWTPVKGYDRLLARLRSIGYRDVDPGPAAPPGNLLPIGYDWRLSIRYTGTWLGTRILPALERWRARGGPYADAQVTFVCHSMGGLVARWHIEMCGGAAYTDKLITLGTPYRGSVKALDQLVNGVHQGIGRLSVDLTDFARSLPSMYQLLPEYACLRSDGGDLAKTTETTIPDLDSGRIADGIRFYDELRRAERARPASLEHTYAIVGTKQHTGTTARIAGSRVTLEESYRTDDENLYGDSTVPLVAACRSDVLLNSNTLRRVADKHGNLQCNAAALDEVEGVLTTPGIPVRAAGETELRVSVPELLMAGDDLEVRAETTDGSRHSVRVTVTAETGLPVESRVLRLAGGETGTIIKGLGPGAYTVDVAGIGVGSSVATISSDVLVWVAGP